MLHGTPGIPQYPVYMGDWYPVRQTRCTISSHFPISFFVPVLYNKESRRIEIRYVINILHLGLGLLVYRYIDQLQEH